MKISNRLPRFSEPTLLVISSPTGAMFYVAQGDEINMVADFRIEKPEYSDREDFGRRSDGRVYETGTKLEKTKQLITRDFKQQFETKTKTIAKTFNVKRLYLFTTRNLYRFLEHILPTDWRNKIAAHLKGDFTKVHPFEILERIKGIQGASFSISASIAS